MLDPQQLQSARITVGGEFLQIQTDLDPLELDKIVQYVDGKILELQTPSLKLNTKRHLILVAMSIASELFAERQHSSKLEEAQERVQLMVEKLTEMLDGQPQRVAQPEIVSAAPEVQVIDPLAAAQAFLASN